MTWHSEDTPAAGRISRIGALRALLRGGGIAAVNLVGLLVLLALRLIEWPLFGRRRPWTPYVTQWVCRCSLRILGLTVRTVGAPSDLAGAVVSNHVSWLDIFVLNAGQRVTFVAKSEVAGWPGIGWLARATGTLFINRRREDVAKHVAAFEARLQQGEQLLFFPEGTSTDGLQVLPFKPALFEAFITVKDGHIQPVSLIYHAPDGADPRTYGWWGTMDFAPHLIATLALPRQGVVDVVYHPAVALGSGVEDRKALAARLYRAVHYGHETGLAHGGEERL